MNRARYILYAFVLLMAFLTYFQINSNFQKTEQLNKELVRPRVGVLIMDTTGDIKIRKDQSTTFEEIKDNEKVYQEETILSANLSTAFLFFPSETSLKIFPNTELTLRRLSYEKDGNIDEIYLKRGAISIKSTKRKMNDHFTVITPSLVIGVRGLEGKIEVNPLNFRHEITKVVSFEGNILVTQHKDEVPLTSEPICTLTKDEMAIEEGFTGNLDKLPFDFNEYRMESLQKFSYSEMDLIKLYHKDQIEKVVMNDGKIVRGVIMGVDDEFIFLHSPENFLKIPKSQVRTLDVEKIRKDF